MTRTEYRNGGALQHAIRGNALPHARLTPDLVRDIRANRQGLTARQWAATIGCHYRTIEKVRHYETWIHI
jgi:hypothetical protein